jgi:hypothetical protein
MGRACSTHGSKKEYIQILLEEREGKIPVGGPRRRWKDNIKMDPREIGWGAMNWIHLAQDRDQWRALVNTEKTFGFQKILENY